MRVPRATAALATGLVSLGLLAQAPVLAMTENAVRDNGEHPAVVALLIVDPTGAWARTYCSGMLIAPTVVLTASHCNVVADNDWFKAGNYRLGVTNDQELATDDYGWVPYTGSGSQSDVVEVVTNPLYKGGYRDDVSAQVIASPLDGVTEDDYPELPGGGLLDQINQKKALRGLPLLVLGYGSQEKVIPANVGYAFPASGERRRAWLPTIALDKQWIHQDQNKGKNPDQAGACYGDSGGPSLLTIDDVTYVVGVTSTGDGPCFATNVASRVDTSTALELLLPLLAEQSG